ATGDGHHPIERHAGGLHDTDGFVATDEPGARVVHDTFGTPQVVEMGMPDDDPVARIDGISGETGAGGTGDAVDVCVEEDRESGPSEKEGRTAIPIESGHSSM